MVQLLRIVMPKLLSSSSSSTCSSCTARPRKENVDPSRVDFSESSAEELDNINSMTLITTSVHLDDKDNHHPTRNDDTISSRSAVQAKTPPPTTTPKEEEEIPSFSDFSNSMEEFDIRWYKYTWTTLLWIVGVLDILAYAEPNLSSYATAESCFDEDSARIIVIQQTVIKLSPFCSVWLSFLQWLNERNVAISFAFSLLWFKLAFNKAYEARYQAMVEQDRCSLCLSPDCMDHGKSKNGTKDMNPQYIYYQQILLHMGFLPMGFYVIIYHFIHDMWKGKGFFRLFVTPVHETIVLSVHHSDGITDEFYEVFNERSKISLIFAVVRHIHLSFLAKTMAVRAELTEYLKNFAVPRLIRALIQDAIRHPRHFQRNFNNIMKYVRWGRYTAPLIGSLNKLRGNVKDLLKKRRQRIIAKKQKWISTVLWKLKTGILREDDAATIIQDAWRKFNARRYTQALILMTQDNKAIAAMRIQKMLRRKLAEARRRILKKRKELHQLEQTRRENPEKLNGDGRRRLYELQDEFTEEAKKTINRRLLLRPNTRFAVAWKVMIVCCIGIEIFKKAVVPFATKNTTKSTRVHRDHVSMQEFIAQSLIPRKVSEDLDCMEPPKHSRLQRLLQRSYRGHNNNHHHQHHWNFPANSSWMCREPFATFRDGFRDIVALILTPSPVSEWPECQEWKPKTFIDSLITTFYRTSAPPPWFCKDPFAVVQTTYRKMVNLLIDKIIIILSIVCFLDVFVTFFTGEIDQTTGELIPKPFLKRWVFPGLLLQLMVNPSIGVLSTFVVDTLKQIYAIGPIRVLRWCIAVFVPIVYGVVKFFVIGMQGATSDKVLVEYELTRKQRSILAR